jgi:hypothetical protein
MRQSRKRLTQMGRLGYNESSKCQKKNAFSTFHTKQTVVIHFCALKYYYFRDLEELP